MTCHCPKFGESIPTFKLIGSQILSQQLQKYAGYIQLSGGVPWVRIAKSRALDQCIACFWDIPASCSSQRGCSDGIPLAVFPENNSTAFRCLTNLKSTYKAGTNRPSFTERLWWFSLLFVQCSESGSLLVIVFPIVIVPCTQELKTLWAPEPGGQWTLPRLPPQKLEHQICKSSTLGYTVECGRQRKQTWHPLRNKKTHGAS